MMSHSVAAVSVTYCCTSKCYPWGPSLPLSSPRVGALAPPTWGRPWGVMSCCVGLFGRGGFRISEYIRKISLVPNIRNIRSHSTFRPHSVCLHCASPARAVRKHERGIEKIWWAGGNRSRDRRKLSGGVNPVGKTSFFSRLKKNNKYRSCFCYLNVSQ